MVCMETPEVLPAENEENDPKKTVSRPPKMPVEQKDDDDEEPVKKGTTGDDDDSGDDSDDDDDSEGEDSDDDDEDPDDDDDDDGETGGGTSSGEEDENEFIWLKKEETRTKNPFFKPENIKPKIPKKEKIQSPEKIERTPWQQMIDFIVHGAKGAMIKNGDISIKEQIADKLLLGLGFKSFKEDIMLQQQAKKYWTQKFTGQKVDTSLLNTDKIVKKIKKEETVQQNKQIRKEKKTEHKNFLTRLIKQKDQESVSVQSNRQPDLQPNLQPSRQSNLQPENLKFSISNQKPEKQPVSSQVFIQQQTQFSTNETNTTAFHGLKEKIGQAVQPTEAGVIPQSKQSVQSKEYQAQLQQEKSLRQNELSAEKTLTVVELKRQEKKEAEINPTIEQSVQKQQKQEQTDFHNMIMMQQMQLQSNMQNTMQNTMQSKMQNEIQQQALQQQMGFVAAARAGLQHFHHQPHRQPHNFQLNELLNKQPIPPEQARSQFMEQQAAFSAASTVATAITKVNAQKTAQNNVSDVQSAAATQSVADTQSAAEEQGRQNPNDIQQPANPEVQNYLGLKGQSLLDEGPFNQNQVPQDQNTR